MGPATSHPDLWASVKKTDTIFGVRRELAGAPAAARPTQQALRLLHGILHHRLKTANTVEFGELARNRRRGSRIVFTVEQG